MKRCPPKPTRTDTVFTYTTLVRSQGSAERRGGAGEADRHRCRRALGGRPAGSRLWRRAPGRCRPPGLRRVLYSTEALPRPSIGDPRRSEEHTSELQSLMRSSYAVLCLKPKNIDSRAIQIHST